MEEKTQSLGEKISAQEEEINHESIVQIVKEDEQTSLLIVEPTQENNSVDNMVVVEDQKDGTIANESNDEISIKKEEIKVVDEQILESDQMYVESEDKCEEFPRRLEIKDARFMIEFDTNPIDFIHEFIIMFF